MKWMTGLLAGIALVGCTKSEPLLDDTRFPTGSRTMAANADFDVLYAVNVDEGTVSKVNKDTGVTEEISVGKEPTRIARAGDLLFVTLRGDRAVAVLSDSPTGLALEETIHVGAEPYGIVADEKGARVWVAVSVENKVLEIDVATRSISQSWDIGKEPKWLALHPSGEMIYVASANGGELSSIEVGENGNGTVEVVPLPETIRTTVEGEVVLTGRIMGDLAVDAFGDSLVVPTLYVDNNSRDDLPDNVDPTQGYYMNPKPGVGRFNSALTRISVGQDGAISRDSESIFLASFTTEDWLTNTVRSYPNSVAISPDGLHYTASMEGSDTVVFVGALNYDSSATDDWWIDTTDEVKPGRHGFVEHPHAAVQTRQGPAGVVFTGDTEAFVHNWMDLSITDLSVQGAIDKVAQRGREGLDDVDSFTSRFGASFQTAESVLPLEVRAGRDLFYSATNPELVAAGSGVSCATCHTDGRNDGLTWQLGPNLRQTPSLAGIVSDTHPVTWTANVDSVAAEAALTSTVRMGGITMGSQDYENIASFIDWTREVDHPDRDATDARIAEGEAIFHREDVGCGSCHSGDAFTDNEHHNMYGLEGVNTPTLRGIVTTAPYLHDGRADTLRTVLEMSRTGAMGDTSMLSETEMDALEAYLKSL